MIIDKLELKNFRGIREMELEFDPKLNVLIGINGSGKSSVLDAITEMLALPFNQILSGHPGHRLDQNKQFTGCHVNCPTTDIAHGCAFVEKFIHISVENYPDPFVLGLRAESVSNTTNRNRESTQSPGMDELAKFILDQSNFPVALLFSTDRALQVDAETTFRGKPDAALPIESKYPKTSTYRDALNNFKRFHWLVQWFKDREEIEVRGLRDISHNRLHELRLEGESPEGIDVQLEAVRTVIEKFTGLKSPRYDGDPLRLVANKGDVQLPIACFSEGEKSLLAMVGDLARRLAIANPERDNPLEGSGVVMIDEVDLHLHPTWQRMVVPRLVETFPNIQFIITTHSPQVLGEIHSDNIVVLTDTPEGIQANRFSREVHGMTSDHILEALMGSSERTSTVGDAIHEAFEALERNDIDQAKERLAWLSENAKDIPELERIAMRIRRKEVVGK